MRIVKKFKTYVRENLEGQEAPIAGAPQEAPIAGSPQDSEKKQWWDENGQKLISIVDKINKQAWLAYLDGDERLANEIMRSSDEKKALALLHHRDIGDLDGIINNTPLNEKKYYRIIDDIN